jgi:hypothetical protein
VIRAATRRRLGSYAYGLTSAICNVEEFASSNDLNLASRYLAGLVTGTHY